MHPLILGCLSFVLLCSTISAQITDIAAGALLSPRTLDFDTNAPGAGNIRGSDAYFTAFGLCTASIVNAPGIHAPTGDVLSSGGTPLTSALCAVNNTLAIVAPQGLMDTQEFGAGFAFRLLPGTSATQFGLTIVDQSNFPIVIETYAGGVLQNSTQRTIPAGFPNPPLIFEDLGGFDEFRVVGDIPQLSGWGIDDLVLGNVAGTPMLCPPLPATPFQINQPNCSLDIDGIRGFGQVATITPLSLQEPGLLTLQSVLSMPPFDMLISPTPLRPSFAITSGQQTLNISPVSGLFINGGPALSLIPLSGPLVIPVQAPFPIVASAQAILLDPSQPDGFSLSQGVQLDVIPCVVNTNFDNLPLGDELALAWVNGSDGNRAWTVNSFATSTFLTGPTSAFSGANYLYCDTSIVNPPTYSFDTCLIDSASLINHSIDFQLSRIGISISTLEVQVDDGDTGNFVTIPQGTFSGPDPLQSQLGLEWTGVSIPLPTLSSGTFRVRFRYLPPISLFAELAIDDLVIN